jgi:hypothetical protein
VRFAASALSSECASQRDIGMAHGSRICFLTLGSFTGLEYLFQIDGTFNFQRNSIFTIKAKYCGEAKCDNNISVIQHTCPNIFYLFFWWWQETTLAHLVCSIDFLLHQQ